MFLTPVMWIREAKNLQCRWMLQDRASDRGRRSIGRVADDHAHRSRSARDFVGSEFIVPLFLPQNRKRVRLLGGLLNRAYGQRFLL
jgi:hypothetical protein